MPLIIWINSSNSRYTYHARNEDESTVRGYIDRGVEKLNDENVRRMAMTVAEQIEKRGASSILYSMLEERFGNIPQNIAYKLKQSDTEILNRFGRAIFRFRDLKDAEKRWDDYGKEGNA